MVVLKQRILPAKNLKSGIKSIVQNRYLRSNARLGGSLFARFVVYMRR